MKHRTVAAVALVALLAVTAGCIDSTEEASALDAVPDEADGVVYFDVTVVEEPDAERLGDAFLEVAADDPTYDGPTEYEDALDELSEEMTDEFGFDPLDVDEAVGFWSMPSWDEEAEEFEDDWLAAFVVGVSDEADASDFYDRLVSVGEYAGGELYVFEEEADSIDDPDDAELVVGELPEGEQGYDFAVGTPESVEMTLEVDAGERASPDGALREEYDALSDGYLKTSFIVPEEVTDAVLSDDSIEELVEGSLFNYDLLFDLRGVSASYSLEDGTHATESRVLSDTEETAEAFKEGIDGYISIARAFAPDEQRDALDGVEVRRDGNVVITTDETTVDEMIDAFDELAEEIEPDEESTPIPTAGISVSQEPGESLVITIVTQGNVDRMVLEGPDGSRSVEMGDDDVLSSGTQILVQRGGFSDDEINGELVTPNEDECRIRHAAEEVAGQTIERADIPCDGSGVEGLEGDVVRYEAFYEYRLIGVIDGEEGVIQAVRTRTSES